MTIYDAVFRILAEVLVLGNAVLNHWVAMPANVSGPLDPSINLTSAGTELIDYIGSSAIHSSQILCGIVAALF